MMVWINALKVWAINNPWIILASICGNVVVFIKFLYSIHRNKKLGSYELIASRYHKIYVPIMMECKDTMVVSCRGFCGRRVDVFKKLAKETLLLITFNGNWSKLKKLIKYFINPQLSESIGFDWKYPDYDVINNIIESNIDIIDCDIYNMWFRVKGAHSTVGYSENEQEVMFSEFVRFVSNRYESTKKYFEQKKPNLLVNRDCK